MFLTRSSSLSSVLRRQPSVRSFFATAPNPATRTEGMSKRAIAEEIAEAHDISIAKSERILNTVLDIIVENVSDDRPVRLRGFGAFEAFNTQARVGRNPQNGEPIQIEAKKRIRFKAYDAFKKTTNAK